MYKRKNKDIKMKMEAAFFLGASLNKLTKEISPSTWQGTR